MDLLTRLAKFTGLSNSEIARRAFDAYLEEQAQHYGIATANGIDLDKEWFTREEVDAIMMSEGKSWRTGRSESTETP